MKSLVETGRLMPALLDWGTHPPYCYSVKLRGVGFQWGVPEQDTVNSSLGWLRCHLGMGSRTCGCGEILQQDQNELDALIMD